MSAITWKNVDKLSSDEMGKSFLDSAQKSGITALDGLGGIVKSYQATADANQAQLKENAANEFMRQLLSAKDSQQLSAMAPTLNEMLASRGAGINQEAAMKALDSRTGVMQARDTATNAFNAAERVQREMPATAALKTAIAKKDPIEAARIRAANPGLSYEADSYTAERALTDGIARKDLDSRFTEQQIDASKSNAAAATLKANTDVKELALKEGEARVKGFDRATEQAAKYETKAREVSAGTINSPEGRKIIDAQIEAMLGKRAPDDKLRETLRANVNAALANPANRGMPVTDFLAAVGSAKPGRTWVGNLFNNEGTYGENIKDDLKGIRSQTGYLDSLEKREKLADSNMAKADQFKTMMHGYFPDLAEAANPTGGVPTSTTIAVPATPPSTSRPMTVKDLDISAKPTAAELIDAGLVKSKAEVKELLKIAPGKDVDKATRDAFYLNFKLEKAKKEAEASAVPGSAAFGLPKKQK